MKNIDEKIYEVLDAYDMKSLESIIKNSNKYYGVDIEKPFFLMTRIPKKKEFHIHSCSGREQLEEYFEMIKKKPLEIGRFQAIRQNKEDFKKITSLWTFRKDHYKTIDEA